jgi:hypothetical protein
MSATGSEACGWGGKEVDDTTPPVEMVSVGSFWGHKGLFEDIGAVDVPRLAAWSSCRDG